MMNAKITAREYRAVNEVLKRLNNMRRWTSFETRSKYNELAKQALNCLTAFLLACYHEEAGFDIQWENFPKIALFRAFSKAYVFYDVREDILHEICRIGEIPRSAFTVASYEFLEEKTSSEFAEYISSPVIGEEETLELRIYRAATKVATLVELLENGVMIRDSEEFARKFSELQRDLVKYECMPGMKELSDVNYPMFSLLTKFSKLRNQNRWAVCPYVVDCSVLGHLFDVGMFAYLVGLEEHGSESVAAKMFFLGIWHDLPEVWTSDIPSPIKDRIPGFRKATETYELQVLEQNFYSKVPEFISERVKQVMMEEPSNEPLKGIMKTADYMSADSECWRQYVAGARDPYYWRAMCRNRQKWSDGIYPIPVEAYRLILYFNDYVEAQNLW